MEIFPYLLSVVLAVLVMHWTWRNERRKPGKPVSGLFRYPEETPPAKPGIAGRPRP